MLRVGDHVFYKGQTFPTIVISMEIVQEGQKYGKQVDEATVMDKSLVMNLTNSHWAYGDQVEVVTEFCRCGKPFERGNTSGMCLTCEKIEVDVINDKMMEDENHET